MVRTAGGNRTRDNLVSQSSALSTELQRYAGRKIDKFELIVRRFSFVVDKFGASLFSVGRVLFPISYSKKPRQQWRGFRFSGYLRLLQIYLLRNCWITNLINLKAPVINRTARIDPLAF